MSSRRVKIGMCQVSVSVRSDGKYLLWATSGLTTLPIRYGEVLVGLISLVGFAEPALPLIGHTPTHTQTLPRGASTLKGHRWGAPLRS